jgi:RHS repeat-associated protein
VRRLQRLVVVTVATALILAGLSAPQWVSRVTGSVAEAAGTGTGGMFVPLQGRLMDTRDGTGGYTTPFAAGGTRSLQVTGQAGLPASGITAVLVNVTALNTTPYQGTITAQPNGASTSAASSFLIHDPNETVSNTGVVEVAADGKIQVTSQRGIHIIVDVQGYFQTGNGSAAPGGFVPVVQQTIAEPASVAPGGYVTNVDPAFGDVQVTGLAGIPSTATAVFANITVVNNAAGAVDNYVKAYPAGGAIPASSLNFSVGTTSIGAAIDLNAQGKLALLVSGNTPGATAVDVSIDVYGYFDGDPSNASYNTQQSRLYDSRTTSSPLQPDETRAITVGGVGGMPTTTSSLAGFALNVLSVSGAGGSGYLTVYGADDSQPAVSSLAYDPGYSSNLVVVKPGTSNSAAPNVVYVHNNGPNVVDVIIDSEGWFTNSNVMAPASGGNPQTSGNRSSQSLLIRDVTDRVQAGVNPVNGNLLINQSLLNLGGVGGIDLNVGIRYNAINDLRPSLNVGLFEAQLFRTNQTFRYTDATGTAFDFTPVSGGAPGTYNVPKDINAHLRRTVNGSPNAAISNGATYELVFHPSQVKNVYVSDGANVKLVRTEDPTGANKITYTYGTGSNGGKLTSITDTQGRVVNFGYSNTPNPTQPTTITDTSLNRTITLAYAGPSGALSQVTDATGAVTTWAYLNGKVSSVTNAGTGSRTDFNYGSGNKISSVVYGANDTTNSGTWAFGYNTTTRVTTVTDPRNKTNTYTYNTDGRVTGTTDARGLAGAASFATHGEVQSRALPGMSSTSYEYADVTEGTYNLTKITSPQASTTEFGYNPSGKIGATADYRPRFSKDAQGNYSTMTYNDWGQPLTVAVGKPDSTDASIPLGGTITYTYQDWPNVDYGADCGGKPGQLCSQVDGKGNTTTFTYDAAGNVTTENLPAPLGDHTYTYDAAGRRISEVDGRGNTAYTCYDKNDRILQISYTSANCATPSGVTYTYDTAGNMKTRTDASGTTTWTWDAQQRATGKDAPGTVNDSTATYDRTGNVLTAADGSSTPTLSTTTYTYDDANNLATLAEPGGSCPTTPAFPNTTKCSVFTMTPNKDTRATVKFPSGVVNTMSYDASDRLNGLTTKNAAGTVTHVDQAYSYTLGTANTTVLQKITDNAAPSNTTTYGYDDLNRLTTATRAGASWAYTYDKNGNRTQQQAVAGGVTTTTNYGYNAADQLCWSGTGTSSSCTAPAGATTYSYDGNGNQTTGGSTYSSYDQLATSTTGASQSYTYAGTSNNTRLTLGAVTFTNNLFNQVTAQTVGTTVTKFVREPDGTPIAMQTGGNSYYYTVDYNQSVLVLTDQNQAKVAGYTYDPYGKTTVTNHTTANIGDANPWRYATGYQDPNTGHYKLGARYYNPTQGRFTQVDPSGREVNKYAYARGNPVTYNDPSGLDSTTCVLSTIMAMGLTLIQSTPIPASMASGAATRLITGRTLAISSAWGNAAYQCGGYDGPPMEVVPWDSMVGPTVCTPIGIYCVE